MKVGVTGHSGYLGKSLVKKFIDNQIEVVTIGRKAESDVFLDLSNVGNPNLAGINCLIHLAGLAHRKQNKGSDFNEINFKASESLIKTAYDQGINKFCFASTVLVYGKMDANHLDESHPLSSNSPYGLSKASCEKFMMKFFRDKPNAEVLILRLPIILGSDAPGNFGYLDSAIRKGNYISLGGNSSKRSIVFRSDICNTIINWLKANEKGVFSLNLCSGETTFNQLELDIAKYHSRKLIIFPFSFGYKIIKILFHRFNLKIPLFTKIALNQTYESTRNFKFVSLKMYSYQNLENELNEID